MTQLPGDKVLIKKGAHIGCRAIITEVLGSQCLLRLVDSDQVCQISSLHVLNYSLAARKAWQKMPTRKVGRPSGTRVSDRVSVTLRIDRELWNSFQAAEEEGLIENRTAAINQLLRTFVDRLQRTRKKAS